MGIVSSSNAELFIFQNLILQPSRLSRFHYPLWPLSCIKCNIRDICSYQLVFRDQIKPCSNHICHNTQITYLVIGIWPNVLVQKFVGYCIHLFLIFESYESWFAENIDLIGSRCLIITCLFCKYNFLKMTFDIWTETLPSKMI